MEKLKRGKSSQKNNFKSANLEKQKEKRTIVQNENICSN